jgi:acetyl-CoA acyltransferase
MNDVYVVACGRSAIGRAAKGALKDTHPVDFAGEVLSGVLKQVPGIKNEDIDDVIIGCATPQQKMGCNMARLIAVRGGLDYSVPAQTINRFCSSGLQSIATGANAIASGQMDLVISGGVEQMTKENMVFAEEYMDPYLLKHNSDLYLPMGITAENVAELYKISRTEADAFSAESHQRAARAQEEGRFKSMIIPVSACGEDGGTSVFSEDQGIRKNTTVDTLKELKLSFKEDGIVTAGNSSQLSDGAAMVVLAGEKKLKELGLTPIARFLGFAVTGVDPSIMGMGPVKAVPKVLKKTGLELDAIDVIELNEAFASQSLACIRELKMELAKVNPNGGAIALGHPLGATGSILTVKALAELSRTGGRYAMVTMCIGGGMGAAGVYERL